MKRLRILSIFMVLFTVLGMVSCDTEPVDPLLLTDDTGGTDTIADPGIFTVKIGGTLFVADSTVATLGDGVITVKGYKGTDGENVTITVPATTTGTYSITDIKYFPGTSGNFYTNLSSTGLPSGSVTINSIDTVRRTVNGVFSFTGYFSDAAQNLPNVAFTEGIFTNISYGSRTNPSGPAAFKVDIDGQTFTATNAQASIGAGLLAMSGIRGTSGEMVSIAIDEIAVGTYTTAFMTYTTSLGSEYAYANVDISTGESTGTFTISSIDTTNHTLSGTFSFVGVYSDSEAGLPNKTFTNGVFTNVPYNGDIDPGTGGDDVFTATVDGNAFEYAPADLSVNWTEGSGDYITMQGFGNDHDLRLTIKSTVVPGSYLFYNAIGAATQAGFIDVDDNEYNIDGGSLVISFNDGTRIKGTFSYDVKNSDGDVIHTVTNGSFDVEYNF